MYHMKADKKWNKTPCLAQIGSKFEPSMRENSKKVRMVSVFSNLVPISTRRCALNIKF